MAGSQTARYGRLVLLACLALGCTHPESLKQGAQSTYGKELRQLAEDINRKELARISEASDVSMATSKEGSSVTPASTWHAPSLAGTVTLQAPVSLEAP